MEIKGTTAVVTGAASGLGAATAAHLAALGAKVVGFDLQSSLPHAGTRKGVDLLPVDATDPGASR